MLYYLTDNKFIHVPKILHLPLCETLLKIYQVENLSWVLNCCSECPSIFVPDAEINDEDDAYLPFIWFHHYRNIISCSLHKQILPEHGKICPLCINIENVDKVKVTTWKSLVLISCSILEFHSEYYITAIENLAFFLYFYILGKIIVQVNNMTCLWVDTLILTVDKGMIIQKYVRYLVSNFTNNNYLGISTFLWKEFYLSNLTNWNHPPYLWRHLIIIYLM